MRFSAMDMLDMDLEAADDGGLQALGRALHLVQHAVNAVPDAETLVQRLEVNVRGADPEGLHDELVDQLDDRGVGIHHRAVVRPPVASGDGPDLDLALGDVLDHLVHRVVGLAP